MLKNDTTWAGGGRNEFDLSGSWQLAFDPHEEGLSRGWPNGLWPEDQAESVEVPAPWNVTHPDAEGVGFYRKLFVLPDDWRGRALRMEFEGASYRLSAWLNGEYLGDHEGSYTPFGFDLKTAPKWGAENELVVRVAALSKNREVDGMNLLECPASKQSWYYTYGGLWGRVHLEALPSISIGSMSIDPDLGGASVLTEVALVNRSERRSSTDLCLEIQEPDGSVAARWESSVVAPSGTSRFTHRFEVSDPLAWTCETPCLYSLRVALRKDAIEIDDRRCSFGMRDFTVRNGQFLLNGKPIFLQGVILQPNYPVNLIVPPDREMMVREISLAKEAGFNLIRLHVRPAPPGYLDVTDRMGMLVYAESSMAWIKDSPRLLDHARREIQAMIDRDRNHPSVVFWGIYNENRAARASTGDALFRFVRALDPSRVIVDNSGGSMCIDQDFGWVDKTTVVPSRQVEPQVVEDIHVYLGAPVSGAVYGWLHGLGTMGPGVDLSAHGYGSAAMTEEFSRQIRAYAGSVFVSELGCGGISDLDETVSRFGQRMDLLDAREMATFRDSLVRGFAERRLDRVFGSVQKLVLAAQELQAAGNRRQIEALISNPRISGYVLTQLNDVAWEFHAGILDLWRNPKRAYHVVKPLNQPCCLILRPMAPVVSCGTQLDLALTLVLRSALKPGGEILLSCSDPDGTEVARYRLSAPEGCGVHEVGMIRLAIGETPGEYRIAARLLLGGEEVATVGDSILALMPVSAAEIPDEVSMLAAQAGTEQAGTSEFTDGRSESSQRWSKGGVILVTRPGRLSREDWQILLERVSRGQTALIGPLHMQDELAVRQLAERGLTLELHPGIGSWMGCYHWVPDTELFEGLPAGGLATEPYVDVLPRYVLSELGGEVLAGSLRNTQTRRESPRFLWYSDIEAVALERGTLIFNQYRCFEKARENPLALRLSCNLIGLARCYVSRN